MVITFACLCGQHLRMGDEWAGKKVRCSACKAVVTVPGLVAAAPAAPPPPPPPPPVRTEAWAYPVSAENNLIALTADAVWARSIVFTSVRPDRDRLAAGEDPATVLGDEGGRIPLADVYRVELDRRRDNLIVHYQAENAAGKRENRSREFVLEDRARRDEIFDTLRDRLGPGWRVREQEAGRLEQVWIGLFGFAVGVVGLYLLLGMIHWIQGLDPLEGFRGRILFALVRVIVWLVQGLFRSLGFVADLIVYAAAAIVIGVSVWMTVSRVRTPPLMWYLEREDRPVTRGSP